jgi:hypothetical protein
MKTSKNNKYDKTDIRARIIKTLNNPKYRMRTIAGISKEANLRPSVVIEALKSDRELRMAIKIVPIRAGNGQILLTTKEKFSTESTLKEKFIDFFASQRPNIEDARLAA